MRISDWSSDVCSYDLHDLDVSRRSQHEVLDLVRQIRMKPDVVKTEENNRFRLINEFLQPGGESVERLRNGARKRWRVIRSEEHTSELQSLMRISYAVFCLKKQKKNNTK